ncbi:MAG TPA: T9SS type A sorting domain-containing protein [Bacteroidetes bacterium]|nr:T9SS type A sorting domain-containing protein [Bacteroidota bacterium]
MIGRLAYSCNLHEMKRLFYYTVLIFTSLGLQGFGQAPQGFFLQDWEPRTIDIPPFSEKEPVTGPVTLAVTIDFHDTLTRISPYLFGDNANLWTGCMSNNKELMHHIASREIGVLRGPGGSISDVFFWNRNIDNPPEDVPATLPGQTGEDWIWYGDRPYPWETWTMDVDSFYRILEQVDATGMITVNYGYARYGTGPTPVATAAHMAAEWVRYDNGRSKFWEIGNEVFGEWEAGYRIDTELNQDGQPEYINGTLYGQHARIFIDSMRAAATETGADIRIGLVMRDEYTPSGAAWNRNVAAQAGDLADFYVVHSYFTPWNTNSGVETILQSYEKAGHFKSYVWNEAEAAGKPPLPVALTEYNIFAVGSNQAVSHVNGMHAVLVTGEAMKTGYGAALRWDLANGWDNGNDHGMFSYGNEPGVELYAPRPAFYHLYYLRKYTGDVLLGSTQTGADGVVAIPTAFHSGQAGITLVNTARNNRIARINIRNFGFGDRFYTYTLTGEPEEDFSRKVYVNGTSNIGVAGGPENYETLPAEARTIPDEILINLPPLSSSFILVEAGTRELEVNEEVTTGMPAAQNGQVNVFPNPNSGSFTISHLEAEVKKLEVRDNLGRLVWQKKGPIQIPEHSLVMALSPGIYFLTLSGKNGPVVSRLIIK